MSVNIADANPEQPILIDELQSLPVGGDDRLWQVQQVEQNHIAAAKISHRNLTDDKWMSQRVTGFEQR